MGDIFLTGGSLHDYKRDVLQVVVSQYIRQNWSVQRTPTIVNGTTAGTLRNTATSVPFSVSGVLAAANLVTTDNFWDLSGETDLAAGQFRAYWLRVDAAGAASFEAGSIQGSAAAALAALPEYSTTHAIIGVYVAGSAGSATDFDDAGGLAAQGAINAGIPVGVPIGVDERLYQGVERINVLNV